MVDRQWGRCWLVHIRTGLRWGGCWVTGQSHEGRRRVTIRFAPPRTGLVFFFMDTFPGVRCASPGLFSIRPLRDEEAAAGGPHLMTPCHHGNVGAPGLDSETWETTALTLPV